jgi:hypothetical protein
VPDRIIIDLSTLIFIRQEDGGALFLDGDGDEILFYASGNPYEIEAASQELLRAAAAIKGQSL